MKQNSNILYIFLLSLLLYAACYPQNQPTSSHHTKSSTKSLINKEGSSIESRFVPPEGYTRSVTDTQSFASYLRRAPLKPTDSLVKYYNGESKSSEGVYVAVFDLDIGKKNLHQCADAIMRLRAEYLWTQKKYDKIHFNFTNGFRVDYLEWMLGKRVIVQGNKAEWKPSKQPSNSYADFWTYMELVFTYAGTASLERELRSVDIHDMKIGDIFIQGGHPGHAIIVVDMAHDVSGKKVYLLAQSYMPAQEIQVLLNPMDSKLSPWYTLNSNTVMTPEWTFEPSDLKRFENQ